MKKFKSYSISCGIFISLSISTTPASASSIDCQKVRIAEPGWTDLAYTSGVTQLLLNQLGYDTSVDILGMNVMLESMKNKDIDVMMGYWQPAMDEYIKPYLKNGSIEVIAQNLSGAKYTYAVPRYVYDAGVTDINDLHKYADKFKSKLYGLEPGSNNLIIEAIKEGKYNLSGWKVVESSEQGMLAQLKRAVRRSQWIAFQAWAPHPMNVNFDIAYLTGTDDTYGPNFGGATVHTTARKGFTNNCPNIGKLLKNMTFTLDMENIGMGYILDEGMSPKESAKKTIQENPEMLNKWLEGVKTRSGDDALPVLQSYIES